ncbi:MAG: DUF1801 domain-containing protein [Planctomycetes bacterium]|nr:DUF1801 domain-containing protein [Planctomycetota bacterium]
MPTQFSTVDDYLASLPADRREALVALRKLLRRHLDRKYVEGMSYGMIWWCVPHSLYPAGYHCKPEQPLPFLGLASQKGHMSLHLFGLYCDQLDGKPGALLGWFEQAWKKSGKQLDMGKACLRFKTLDDLALDVLAELFRRMPCDVFVALYDRAFGAARSAAAASTKQASTKQASTKKASASRASASRASATKPAAKTTAAKSTAKGRRSGK